METYVCHVTKECNCMCRYCYEQDKTSIYAWNDVYNFICNMVEYRTSDTFNIEFLGGEPLLAFNHIVGVVETFKDVFPNITIPNFIITTNGTILNDNIVYFLKDNPNVRFCASLDGTRFMNMLRITKELQNTYDLAMPNLKRLISEGLRPSVHMVTHPFNVGYLSMGIEHIYNQGIMDIGIGTVESTIIIGKEYCDRFISELKIISNKIKHGLLPGLNVHELNSLKPREDKRHYIYDESGKVIGETYGRSGNDIVSKNDKTGYIAQNMESKLGCLIEDIREIVYTNHQKIMRGESC